MTIRSMEGFEVRTYRKIRANSDSITLSAGEARRLNKVGKDNHVYLVVQDPLHREVVRYEHTEDWGTGASHVAIPVERDVANMGRKNFGTFACLRYELTMPEIQERMDNEYGKRLQELEDRVKELEEDND